MNLDTKEFIKIAIEDNLKKIGDISLSDRERVESAQMLVLLTKALREVE